MCDPIVGTALMIASTGAGLIQQQQAAKTQEQANERQYEETVKAYNRNQAEVDLKRNQLTEQAQQKLTENNMAAAKAMATARVSAGESGVGGISVDALLADLGGQRDTYNQSVQRNYRSEAISLENERQNLYSGAQSTINGLKTPAMPDYLGAGLKIGTAIYDYKNPKVN